MTLTKSAAPSGIDCTQSTICFSAAVGWNAWNASPVSASSATTTRAPRHPVERREASSGRRREDATAEPARRRGRLGRRQGRIALRGFVIHCPRNVATLGRLRRHEPARTRRSRAHRFRDRVPRSPPSLKRAAVGGFSRASRCGRPKPTARPSTPDSASRSPVDARRPRRGRRRLRSDRGVGRPERSVVPPTCGPPSPQLVYEAANVLGAPTVNAVVIGERGVAFDDVVTVAAAVCNDAAAHGVTVGFERAGRRRCAP